MFLARWLASAESVIERKADFSDAGEKLDPWEEEPREDSGNGDVETPAQIIGGEPAGGDVGDGT